MTTTTIDTAASQQLTSEAGGWLARRTPLPDLRPDAMFLLSQSSEPRSGNLRFAIEGGQVYLLGELPDPEGRLTRVDVDDRLFAAAESHPTELTKDEVAGLLSDTGHLWEVSPHTSNFWQTSLNDPDGRRYILSATQMRAGVEIGSQIVDDDVELGESQRLALARFLMSAHARIRFARFTLQSHAVSVVSFATADRISVELSHSVEAVLNASRLVGREVRALTVLANADAYLKLTE